MRQKMMCVLLLACCWSLGTACGGPLSVGVDGVPPTVGSNETKEAVPVHNTSADAEFTDAALALQQVSLVVPTQQQASTTPAKIYLEAWKAAKNINGGLRRHIEQIRTITSHRPRLRLLNKRVWGPHTPTLAPYTLLFAVERVGVGQYRYLLTGKPKGALDKEYRTLFEGGFQRGTLARRGAGKVLFHFDRALALDPTVKERGKAHVIYDTRSGSIQIKATFKGAHTRQGTPADAVYTYLERSDKSGDIKIAMSSDLHHGKSGLTAEEKAYLHAQWLPSGAGKGSISYRDGDLKQLVVTLVECWGRRFQRTYYRESHNAGAAFGRSTACVMP